MRCVYAYIFSVVLMHRYNIFIKQLNLFAATVEQCLLDGVKRRAVGFMRSNKLANLYSKVGKAVPAVQELIKQIEEAEAKIDG